MGNPNCVVMMEEISRKKALHLGPYVENSKYFPDRINMQLCHVVDRENIQIEIYERGAGYTYASGTGACAAASAAHKLGLVGNCVKVHMQGGDLLVEFAEDDRVFMTGPVVYIGSITLAENFFCINWKISWCCEYCTAGHMGTIIKKSCNCRQNMIVYKSLCEEHNDFFVQRYNSAKTNVSSEPS